MNLTVEDFAELSRKRVEVAKATKKDSFSMFALCKGGKKAVTNVNADPLCKADSGEPEKVG